MSIEARFWICVVAVVIGWTAALWIMAYIHREMHKPKRMLPRDPPVPVVKCICGEPVGFGRCPRCGT